MTEESKGEAAEAALEAANRAAAKSAAPSKAPAPATATAPTRKKPAGAPAPAASARARPASDAHAVDAQAMEAKFQELLRGRRGDALRHVPTPPTSPPPGTRRRRRAPPASESAARAPLAPPAAGPAAPPPPAEAAAALTPLSALRLLSVCDSESGEGLFERVWRWPEGADPKGIGNLVRSFFLVARQLDHGMISRVVFEAPEDEAALVPHAGIGEAMEMLCTRNERVVVAVFHESRGAFADEDDEEAREVHVAMRQLVEQARELWSPDVSRADFKTTVDRLCARIVGLPPPPPDPRQPSPPPRPKSM
ncbi:unnamed protein product [Pelagomonas calceolata]|uniref:Uncharacterized protein n=2 Tax=Pelagomonas calceolata TaxID=35677 RepID=A0A8J2S945_9STRA|nr:unnamed protein product [Pelagomonas calceolata]